MKTHWCWIIPGILFGSFLSAARNVCAQPQPGSRGEYLITAWTTEQRLPHNTIHSIRQTQDGYLWLATLDGLVRYDGVRFTVFDKSNTPGFTTNRLTFLFEDQDGALWIGTEDAGLMRYANGVFSSLTTKDGLPHNHILNIQSDNADGLQITVPGAVVFWRRNRLIYDPDNLVQRRTKRYFAPSGAMWTADQTGLRRVKDGVTTNYPLLIDPDTNHVAVFYEDRQGALWFGVSTPGLFKIKDGVVTRYAAPHSLPAGVRWRKFCEDRQGNLWIGTLGGGLLRFHNGQFTGYTQKDGLSDNKIQDFLIDREGNLWAGTNTGGLNRLSQIENFGLTKTIRGMCQQAERTSGIRFTAELQNIDGLFSKEAELNVYRIVQESVNNILKHSQATEANLTLERAGREVRLCIADNGRGFAIADSSADAVSSTANPHSGGFGLIGLAERVRMLKGVLAIETSDGKGTAITISLPIEEGRGPNETNGHH